MAQPAQADRDDVGPAADIDFSLVTGDLLHRAQRLVGLIPSRGLGTGRRIAIAIGVTWLPLALWAVWNQLFLPGVAEEPLLRHFGIHARFLVALPLFLASEGLVERTLRRVVPQFLSSGLIDAAQLPDFRRILVGTGRLRDSRLALGVIIGLVVVISAIGWGDAEHNHELAWAQSLSGRAFAAAWFSCVSRPIFLLALLAWLWRLAVLTRLFQRIAALDLKLAPTHPDRTGGLAFVEKLPAAFAPFFFGIALVIAGRWGHDAMYHGLRVEELGMSAGLLVVLSVLIGAAPLAVFVGKLLAVKRTTRPRQTNKPRLLPRRSTLSASSLRLRVGTG